VVTASDRYSLLVLMALFCFYVTPDIYMIITSADKTVPTIFGVRWRNAQATQNRIRN